MQDIGACSGHRSGYEQDIGACSGHRGMSRTQGHEQDTGVGMSRTYHAAGQHCRYRTHAEL